MSLSFKNLLDPGKYPDKIHFVLLLLRVTAGIFMITHGITKVERLMADGPAQFADPLGLGVTTSLILVVFSEVFCSVLLIIGLWTRFAVIPLMITMFVVSFIVHGADPFNKQELPMFYLIVYLCILIAGAGKYSVDNLIFRKKR